MKERPILFSGPMVRAMLDGTKTQTRRVVLPQPMEVSFKQRPITYSPLDIEIEASYARTPWVQETEEGETKDLICPYGRPGDRLWVREACWIWGNWHKNGTTPTGRQKWRFLAGPHQKVRFTKPSSTAKRGGESGWVYRHARFMPRWASRINLEVVNVRVERLQEISEADAKAEGASMLPWFTPFHGEQRHVDGIEAVRKQHQATYRNGFATLWDSINAARGHGWDTNPWVWVVEFRRVQG